MEGTFLHYVHVSQLYLDGTIFKIACYNSPVTRHKCDWMRHYHMLEKLPLGSLKMKGALYCD